MAVDPGILAVIIVLGACFGSFITAASWRLPREEDIVFKHSECPKCHAKLKAIDLIPVFSWLLAKGKCRYCKARVSARYVLTELFAALVFALLYLKYGLTPEFWILAMLAVAMLVLVISDFETYIIPDSTTVSAFVLALAWHYTHNSDWLEYGAGFAVCLAVALGMRYGFWFITKREGLGFGDVKFLPVAGLWVGFSALPAYFIISGLAGILTGIIWRIAFKNPEYPFGPALAIAMFLLVVFPELNFLVLQPK